MAYTTIDDPSVYFQTAIYAGNGSTQSITNDGNSDLQPDWIWFANRTNAPRDRIIIDSTRGVDLSLYSNQTKGDQSLTDVMSSFNSDGFSLESNVRANESSQNHVAWQWKANGGTTASNSDGSITSTVQANTTAGFSIVTYTGTGSTATVGHGLGAKPDVYIVKNREEEQDWMGYFNGTASDPETDGLRLNTTDAITDASSFWNDTAPTSSVFTVNTSTNVNKSSIDYIAYCFTSIQGYSKFGSYTGTGSEDGPFVYLGFKPQWILFKNTGAAEEWVLQDTTRNPNNPVTKNIRVDSNIAEGDASSIDIDFLSNGFKNRSDQAQINSSGVTYIYMAFAEHPFVSSKGAPVTAR